MPFLERVQADLQERARAIMELRPQAQFRALSAEGSPTLCRQGTTRKGVGFEIMWWRK
jgi:hypothetical protein